MNVDILSGADGYFDDLSGDSVNFNRANFDFLAFGEQVTASQYIADNDISIGDPEFEQYLCYPNGCQKTESWKSSNLIIGTGFGAVLGWYLSGVLNTLLSADIGWLFIAIFGMLGFLLASKKPKVAEWAAFAMSGYVFLQAGWDYGANDWSSWRQTVFVAALVLFIINVFTGQVKWKGANKLFKRLFGL